ncbi:MAG: LLM class flavin-dependent oxidoreductase [Cyanobacteriota bacterium]|nr:LLM class flavin-dependent oxidoreductase [Cyanobacteriota bacterium]
MKLPRFGVWAPVYGNWGSRHHPQDPFDASYARTRATILQAEALGFDSTLIAQHIVNPNGQDLDQLETWTTAAALAEATEKIEIIAAIKPLLFHPAVIAKMSLNIDAISRGRFAINLVSAWFKTELEKAGIPFPDHDDRYRYSTEWLQVVKALWTGERVTKQGEFFQISDLSFRPQPTTSPYPRIYLGGESDPARQLAAAEADVFFINGRPLPEVQAIIQDVSRRQRHGKPRLKFALAAFVIARPTSSEAEVDLDLQLARSVQEDRSFFVEGADPKAVMLKLRQKYRFVGTNGGTAAGLVGSYDTVAERILRFADIGIETFMLQFQPLTAEMIRFAQEVIPRVQRLQALAHV